MPKSMTNNTGSGESNPDAGDPFTEPARFTRPLTILPDSFRRALSPGLFDEGGSGGAREGRDMWNTENGQTSLDSLLGGVSEGAGEADRSWWGSEDISGRTLLIDKGERPHERAQGAQRTKRNIPSWLTIRLCLALSAASILMSLLVTVLVLTTGQAHSDTLSGRRVILVSLDGFRASYLDKGLTPTLSAMARGGWHGVIRPSFPSITFPNHYTIVTGLYPQSHGIVANIFYDPTFNDTFVYVDNSKNTQAKWWGGEPIWNTVIKQGYKSASCMWPGSEAPIQGMRPTYWFPYKGSVSPKSRIDHVLAWLDLPVQDRPLLSTVYISNVDTAGHYFGTNSSQVEEALTVVDGALAYLVGEIARRGMEQDVNVVVVSDHGMADGSPQRLLALDKLIDISKVKIIDNLPMIYVYPNSDADTDPNYATLEAASKDPNWHFKVWKREAAPSQFHYSDNMRIGPIVLLPDVGWMFITNSSIPEHVPGIHGYDPAEPSMHAIFVAHGPRFEGGRNLGDFENVGIYNLLSRVMGMQPAPNNGTDWGTKLLAQVSD